MNFDKRSYFRTKSEHPMVSAFIDQAHYIMTTAAAAIGKVTADPEFSPVGKDKKISTIAEDTRKGLTMLRGEINQRHGNIGNMKSQLRQPALTIDNPVAYAQAQEVRQWILDTYPQPEYREKVLPDLMAQNIAILQAVSSCPLPELRRQFISDEAFKAGVDAWTKANNDQEKITLIGTAEMINEECLVNLQIAEQALNQLAGAAPEPAPPQGPLTRTQLANLSPGEQHAFFQANGTVTD